MKRLRVKLKETEGGVALINEKGEEICKGSSAEEAVGRFVMDNQTETGTRVYKNPQDGLTTVAFMTP